MGFVAIGLAASRSKLAAAFSISSAVGGQPETAVSLGGSTGQTRATERALLEEGGGHEAEDEDEQGKKSGGEAIGV